MPDFQDEIQKAKKTYKGKKPKGGKVSKDEIIKDLNDHQEADEKKFLKGLKSKNKDFLVNLTLLEKERIARWICERYNESKDKHVELTNKMDEWDSVYRMERVSPPGDDGTSPNYRTPLSTVALEVMHATIINVFFSPKEVMRVIPTEPNDAKKVKKLTTFGNWSMENEMKLFEAIDRLFHSSGKNGECPYIIHWVKKYGTKIEREIIRNPANPAEALYDEDTKEPLYQEREKVVLLYNAPQLEVISRRDYIQPNNARMGVTPDWEIVKLRYTYDRFLREQMEGKIYDGAIEEISDWNSSTYNTETGSFDYLGDYIPQGAFEKEFIFFYGKMRINILKEDKANDFPDDQYEELEDEFIAMVHYDTQTLCQLRKNKFPLKMRPIGIDYFIPDDDGRRVGLGVMEFLKDLQKAEDGLFNQFIRGVVWANSPPGFFTPTGNMRDDPIRAQAGYLYPSASAKDVSFMKIPQPDRTIQEAMERIERWAQLLFGISDYTSGVESSIDPTAPARKAEIVVAQGNVRFNLILKRKMQTFKDIFLRWFLLYQENMPPNKFMRITGEQGEDWSFEQLTSDDFSLTGLPDFELTGNALNSNKNLEVQKYTAVYDRMLANPLFSPATVQGLTLLAGLTKWFLDKIDATDISRQLPSGIGEQVQTPEEENARFLQGDSGEPIMQEDHIDHIRKHSLILNDPMIPPQVKQIIQEHIVKHVRMMNEVLTMQLMTGGQGQGQTQPAQPAQPAQGDYEQADAGAVDEASNFLRQ